MLFKCCTQYVNKLGKLSNGHRTRKKFSFQSQRRAMLKNFETTIWLYSFHMLARLPSKSFKLGFSGTWTDKFQMYLLGFEKSEKPEIKLPTLVGSWRKQGSYRKTSTSASLTKLKPLTVWITTVENSLRDGSTRWPYLSPEKPMQVKKQKVPDMEQLTGSKLGKKYDLYAESIMQKTRLDESQARIECWE